jgi:hypothetical protein
MNTRKDCQVACVDGQTDDLPPPTSCRHSAAFSGLSSDLFYHKTADFNLHCIMNLK